MKKINRRLVTSLLVVLIGPSVGCLSVANGEDEPNSSVSESQLTSGPSNMQVVNLSPRMGSSSSNGAVSDVKSQASGTTDEFFILENRSTQTIFLVNGFSLSGTPILGSISSVPPGGSPETGVQVPASVSLSQALAFTTNPASPTGVAKTCEWLVTVTFNGSCSGQVSTGSFGTQAAICSIDPSQAFINTATCGLTLGLTMQ